MEDTRTYTLRIIIVCGLALAVGFLIGLYSVRLLVGRVDKGAKSNLVISGNTIMTKRMQAIKEAQKKGKDTYEFEVTGFHPVINNKN